MLIPPVSASCVGRSSLLSHSAIPEAPATGASAGGPGAAPGGAGRPGEADGVHSDDTRGHRGQKTMKEVKKRKRAAGTDGEAGPGVRHHE